MLTAGGGERTRAISFLSQCPGGTVLGVLYYKTELGHAVADEVGGGPVLVGLGFGPHLEE